MAENEVKRSWVWASTPDSVAAGTVSVLAVVETLGASAFGLWLWFAWGLYPLLLSSLVMAVLTMLRSEPSVRLGRDWFVAYEEGFGRNEFLSPRRKWTAVLIAALAAGGAVYWIASTWLPGLSGWALFWRAGVLGWIGLNVGLAIMATVAFAGAGAIAIAVATAATGAAMGAGAGAAAAAAAVAAAVAVEMVLLPGFAIGVLVRALLTRAAATLRYLGPGVLRFPGNWSALITATDLRTEPELVPGLPDASAFRIDAIMSDARTGGADDRIIATVIIPILFLPTWLFRLTLKSTFLFYWPLLFVASAPAAYKTGDGRLVWDDARGRRVLDWIAVALALAALVAIGATIYDPSVFAAFVAWADPRGLPSHSLLQAFGFKIWELDLWEWFAALAAASTVIVFLWANAINLRHRGRDRQPGWGTLKAIYALDRTRLLLVWAAVLTSGFAMLWFVHDTCTLPDALTRVLTYVLGPPETCQ